MSSVCPHCRSEILPGEVSIRPEAADDDAPGERLELVRCLCCGADLSRAIGTEDWKS